MNETLVDGSGAVGKHTAHYLDMVEHVSANALHGYHFHHLMAVFQIAGPFDAARFKAAVMHMTQANPAMRISFSKHGGAWTQNVATTADPRLFEHRVFEADVQDWKKRAHDEIQVVNDTPFALTGEPLAKIIALDFKDATVVFGKFHHIVCDGWGILVAMNQLLGFYMAELAGTPASIPTLPTDQYLAIAEAEKSHLSSAEGNATLAWWKNYLGDHALIRTPLPTRPSGFLGICPGLLSERCNRGLEDIAAAQGFHISYLPHAAFVKALGVYLGSDDILLTYVKANRNDGNSGIMGNFADWLPVRHRLNLDRPLPEIARAAQLDVSQAKERYVPYWKIVEDVCPAQYLNDFGITPYSFDFVPAFEPKVDFGGGVSFHLLHDLQVFPFRLTATDIFCRATQYRDPLSGRLNLSVDLIYHAGFLPAEKVQEVSRMMLEELEKAVA